jgi:hypothetical protein
MAPLLTGILYPEVVLLAWVRRGVLSKNTVFPAAKIQSSPHFLTQEIMVEYMSTMGYASSSSGYSS